MYFVGTNRFTFTKKFLSVLAIFIDIFAYSTSSSSTKTHEQIFIRNTVPPDEPGRISREYHQGRYKQPATLYH